MRNFLVVLCVCLLHQSFAQSNFLTVEKIMRDPKWIGTSPSAIRWSWDSKEVYFNWNPDQATSDSIYLISIGDPKPRKATVQQRQSMIVATEVVYNTAKTLITYTRYGDLFITDLKTGQERRITKTVDSELSPVFINNDQRISYIRNQNLYAFDIKTGLTEQLTNFVRGSAPSKKENLPEQEKWLREDQLREFEVLRSRRQRNDSGDAIIKASRPKELRTIYIDDKNISSITISPGGDFVTYRLSGRPTNVKNSIVPNYVTESGFTEDISSRTKVGAQPTDGIYYIFDRAKDSVRKLNLEQLPGIHDRPDYASKDTALKINRTATMNGPFWNGDGSHAIVVIRSSDNKDQWIMKLDPLTAKLSLLDRQRDEAWIGGPGIGNYFPTSIRWIDNNLFWFQSESSGYSHVYTINAGTGQKSAVTSGKFEVKDVTLANDRKSFYVIASQVHPGEHHLYKVAVGGGPMQKLTTLSGGHEVSVSPDDRYFAIRYSYSNKPWELYLQENKPNAKMVQVTNKAQSAEFQSYPWMDPELVSFTAGDGSTVYARLYKPSKPHPSRPAVIFVHGAGYLQNVHRWWSLYFREYMFHNLLAEQGYTVLDIDYRGSEGYGRDWRTGIYRHMGGKDLTDQLDGAKYLIEKHGVDPKRLGIYGGSYGGFITLMAMFTQPDVFAAGAALRSVTDWAHYNHNYTSNILNEPFRDTLAYRKSSPIYYANGLKGALLMCHGMVDLNVHFQDIVRLAQRLIELKKENWELAVYPVEDHAFVESSSWTDEYKRILKLFETNLKK